MKPFTTSRLASLAACLASWVVVTGAVCPPPGLAPIQVDWSAVSAEPWYTRQLLQAQPYALFCERTVFTPLLSANASAGFTSVTTAAVGKANAPLITTNPFNAAEAANTQVAAFQGAPDKTDASAFGTAVSNAAAAQQVALIPAGNGRLAVAPASKLQGSVDYKALPEVWVVAVGPSTSTTQPPAVGPISYDWLLLSGGAPTVQTDCGCTYSSGQAAGAEVTPTITPTTQTRTSTPIAIPVQLTEAPSPAPQSPTPTPTPTLPPSPSPSPSPSSTPSPGQQSGMFTVRIVESDWPFNTNITTYRCNITGDNGTAANCTSSTSNRTTVWNGLQGRLREGQDQVKQVFDQVKQSTDDIVHTVQKTIHDVTEGIGKTFKSVFGSHDDNDDTSSNSNSNNGRRKLMQSVTSSGGPSSVTVRRQPAPENITAPASISSQCLAPATCGCNSACATSAPESGPVLNGGLWLLTRQPDDPTSVQKMREQAQTLGFDISGLMAVCQQGCWAPTRG